MHSQTRCPAAGATASAMGDEARDLHILAVAGRGIAPAAPSDGRTAAGSPDAAQPGAAQPGATGATGAAPAGSGEKGRGDDGDRRSEWRETLLWCVIPVLLVLLVRLLLIGCYEIPSRSMEDTIVPGDRVVTSKLSPRPFPLQRGDIIVFHDPAHWLSDEQAGGFKGDYLIKRLIGLPGDTVECEGAGRPVEVNGVALDESAYIRPGVEPSAFPFRVEVTEGHVFVLGDNRANSADSRYHQDDGDNGLVPVSDVVGVALARYWPLNRIGLLDAHHEVFAGVPDPSAPSGNVGASSPATDGNDVTAAGRHAPLRHASLGRRHG